MVTVDDVRLLTSIDSSDINDSDISSIIDKAWIKLMDDITALVARRLNTYAPDTIHYRILNNDSTGITQGYIFDINNDGIIDYNDVDIFYFDYYGIMHTIDTPFNYNLTDASLTFNEPLNMQYSYYIKYREVYTDNNNIIDQAHLWLSAYLLALKVWGMAPQVVRFGRSGWNLNSPGKVYYDTYIAIVRSINPIGRHIEYEYHPTILNNTI